MQLKCIFTFAIHVLNSQQLDVHEAIYHTKNLDIKYVSCSIKLHWDVQIRNWKDIKYNPHRHTLNSLQYNSNALHKKPWSPSMSLNGTINKCIQGTYHSLESPALIRINTRSLKSSPWCTISCVKTMWWVTVGVLHTYMLPMTSSTGLLQ